MSTAADPLHVIDVRSLDAGTVRLVARQIEASHTPDHLVYRESELDALWTLADMAAHAGVPGAPEWVTLLWEAHDLVGDGEPAQSLVPLGKLVEALDG